MWEHMFNELVLKKIINEYCQDETEDLKTMKKAIEHFSAFVEYEEAIKLAISWKGLDMFSQIGLSIVKVGIEESSRFMIVMDYLSDRLEIEGELT